MLAYNPNACQSEFTCLVENIDHPGHRNTHWSKTTERDLYMQGSEMEARINARQPPRTTYVDQGEIIGPNDHHFR